MKFFKELKYFWNQIRHDYPRQADDVHYNQIIERLHGLKLKNHSYTQCLLAAAFFPVRADKIGVLTSFLTSLSGRGGTTTLEGVVLCHTTIDIATLQRLSEGVNLK